MILQKYKKNDIVKAIQGIQLNPREFDIREDENESRIVHKPPSAYFVVGGSPVKYVGEYKSGDSPAWPYEAYSWKTALRRISSWLDEVKRDIETPDLWAELQNEAELLEVTYDKDTENTPFTTEEKKKIAKQFSEFSDYAQRTYSLSAAQMNVLNAKLDYLVKATDRLGRVDWRNALLGVIIGYVLTIALPTESARSMFFILLRSISQIHGFPALPNP
jgi:hypothetical protein